MSFPVFFPKRIFFYPIGNTSAVSLTKDLAPEEPGHLLLLGCGDPRNILYTIYSNSVAIPRKLDFTCCDIEAAVLARNVLFLTMLADNHDVANVWSIWFHMYLDKLSLSVLLDQCQTLIDASETIQTWQNSKYGTYLRMCTSHTLAKLRRHWTLYVKTKEFSPERMQQLRDRFQAEAKSVLERKELNLTSSRSAGSLWVQAMRVTPEHFRHFWKTGITSVDPRDVAAATFINPTFAYSISGEGFFVHYGTDPLLPFHLAPIFAPRNAHTIQIADVVDAAKAQFRSWCDTFHASIRSSTSPIIRFFAGDALAFCHGLRYCASNQSIETSSYIGPWNGSTINLDGGGYADGQAPTTFNVIDTSNLADHIGTINILVAAAPLLSRSPSSALCTETLLPSSEDPTSGLTNRMCADVPIISLLIGLAPTTYASRFDTYSISHDILMNLVTSTSPQTHERITWKMPALGDTIATSHDVDFRRLPAFDAPGLARCLFDIYLKMFANEDISAMMSRSSLKDLQESSLVYYIRESFAMLVKLIKSNVEADWNLVMDLFLSLVESDNTLLMGMNNYQDLSCQLRLHGVYSLDIYKAPLKKVGRFQGWDFVPPIVRVVFNIPREKIAALENMDPKRLGTPILHCDIQGPGWHNIFSSIKVAFGRVTLAGSKRKPEIIFEEDPAGWYGKSPLVAWLWMPSWILVQEPHATNISFSIRSTPASIATLTATLGMGLKLFTTRLMDETHIYIVPEQPNMSQTEENPTLTSHNPRRLRHQQIGRYSTVQVVLDDECRKVATLGIKLHVEEPGARSAFSSGAQLKAEQVSPCVVTVSFADFTQELAFPFPVIGSRSKLRVARKLLYIEVIVQISGPLLPDGFSLNPFPVIVEQRAISIWSIHRVNLCRLPVLDTTDMTGVDWFNSHIGMMMSDRERALRDRGVRTDVLMNVKSSLHSIFISAAGVQGPKIRIFGLADSQGIDTLIFVTDLRFDLPVHTIVADGYALPLTEDTFDGVLQHLQDMEAMVLSIKMFGEELKAWKQLLPAFTERCRQWQHKDSCEYILKGSAPLSEKTKENPLCSCGRGQDIEEFLKLRKWDKFAPIVTRIALGPFFAVSYLEKTGNTKSGPQPPQSAVGSQLSTGEKCAACGGPGKPKLLVCSRCKKVMYCSAACQKGDWKASHKNKCGSSAA